MIDGGVSVEVTFTPRRQGLHTVDVHWHSLPVTGSPFHVTAHASESEDRLQEINVVERESPVGHLTATVLLRTSTVSASC